MQSMFSPWVTLWISVVTLISSNCFFYWKQLNFISETVFFFVLRLVTVFDLALLRELQNRPWKTSCIVVFGVITSEHLVKCFFLMDLSMTYDTAFCFGLFVQNILFYINESVLSIFLEFQKLPCCGPCSCRI